MAKWNKHKLYALYDMKDNEVCIGLFTREYIEKNWNITSDGFFRALRKKSILRKRYIVMPTDFYEEDEI